MYFPACEVGHSYPIEVSLKRGLIVAAGSRPRRAKNLDVLVTKCKGICASSSFSIIHIVARTLSGVSALQRRS